MLEERKVLKSPDEVQSEVRRRFENRYKDWIVESVCQAGTRSCWPLEIPLSIPSEQEAATNLGRVQSWINAWRAKAVVGEVIWARRRWRALGTQTVPDRLVLKSPEEAAAFLGESSRWERLHSFANTLFSEWPASAPDIPRFLNALSTVSEEDFARILSMLRWLTANPKSGLYPRQIPIAGMDSKWIEQRMSLLGGLYCAIAGLSSGTSDFFTICGLRPPPQYVCLRVLDPIIRSRVAGLRDIHTPVDDLAGWDVSPSLVFVVENLQTGLAFCDFPGAVMIMGLGYSVDVLRHLPWLQKTRCFYWGDLDTHGFAILNRARSYVPNLKSILMDEQTLLSHRELWGRESEQAAVAVLPLLTELEQLVYQGLKESRWGHQVRLEQERISWQFAEAVLQSSFIS